MADLAYTLKNSVQSTKSISQKKANNVYTFKVQKSSNKFQIKIVLEEVFGVKVDKVRISRKKPFFKNRRTRTSLEKKAFVKLKEGYKIDGFEKITEIMKDSFGQEEVNSISNEGIVEEVPENDSSLYGGIDGQVENNLESDEVLAEEV